MNSLRRRTDSALWPLTPLLLEFICFTTYLQLKYFWFSTKAISNIHIYVCFKSIPCSWFKKIWKLLLYFCSNANSGASSAVTAGFSWPSNVLCVSLCCFHISCSVYGCKQRGAAWSSCKWGHPRQRVCNVLKTECLTLQWKETKDQVQPHKIKGCTIKNEQKHFSV